MKNKPTPRRRATSAPQRPPRPAQTRRPHDTPPPEDTGAVFADVLSGAFDDDAKHHAAAHPPAKRVLQPQPESPKLHKVLAQAGMGSRLDMEALIAQGRISVNQQPAHVGQRIQYGDVVRVDGRIVRVRIAPPLPRVIAYHKPVGELVTRDDPQNRPTVFRTLPRLAQGKWQSVGRLDINTEGLLLLTSSGTLANQLMHPRFGLQREYAVRVLGALSDTQRQALLEGVQLQDGSARFGSIEDGGGEGVNQWYKVTISEGRNREVRRMFEAVGHAVSRLIRIRYGMLTLPRGLRRGAWTELGERDVKALMDMAGMQDSKRMQQVRAQEHNNRRRAPDRGGAGLARSRAAAAQANRPASRQNRSTWDAEPPPHQHRPQRPPRGTANIAPQRPPAGYRRDSTEARRGAAPTTGRPARTRQTPLGKAAQRQRPRQRKSGS